jgi:hypothetical protein
LARIAQQLAEVFAVIDAAVRDILAESCEFYASGPHAVRLVCGFAEGADQLAVAASPPDWQVEAILPFGKDEYLNDLAALVREPRREETAEMLIATARILSEDVAAWQQLYGRKRLTLPA